MTKIIMALLFLLFISLFLLLFWIVFFTIALLIFSRGEKGERLLGKE